MDIQVNPKIIAACKEAGIKAVRIRTPGRNKGRWGWCVVVDDGDALDRSGSTYANEELAYAGAYYHYTSQKVNT